MSQLIYACAVNPEPWKTPPMSAVRKGGRAIVVAGRDVKGHSYKEAIRDELLAQGATVQPGPYKLTLLFWRRLDTYETKTGRNHTRHRADATNMQKLTEDALQGVLIDNDVNVHAVSAEIIEQGKQVQPMVVIILEPAYVSAAAHLGFTVQQQIRAARERASTTPTGNDWSPAAGQF